MKRDLMGYGGEPPHARWPGDARLAVTIVVNVEEGSEPGPLDGDAEAEVALTEITGFRVPDGDRDIAAESVFDYGTRAGLWTVHRLFTERGLWSPHVPSEPKPSAGGKFLMTGGHRIKAQHDQDKQEQVGQGWDD